MKNPYGITEKEAQVLRLVDRTRSTGEIAEAVGRSIHTVEAQIKSARRRLGGLDRFRAADMLRRAEAASQAEVNPDAAMGADLGIAPEEVIDPRHEAATDDEPDASPPIPDGFVECRPAAQPEGVGSDERSALTTIALILAVAAASAVLLLAAPSLGDGAQRLAHHLLSKP